MANALIDLGLEPGDRVGVLEDNSVEAVDFFLGAAIANLFAYLFIRAMPASRTYTCSATPGARP